MGYHSVRGINRYTFEAVVSTLFLDQVAKWIRM
jgi:hypothetical protein